MSTFFSKEVEAGLRAARKAAIKKASRLRVVHDDESHPIMRMWENGFALDADTASHVRGLVDVYDGGRHLYQCLIVASESDGYEVCFDFKRSTEAVDRAPLDFYRDPDAPIALLARD